MTTKANIREQLVEELTKANGSTHYSWDMVHWIEAGKFTLSVHHSDRAHELAAQLTAKRS